MASPRRGTSVRLTPATEALVPPTDPAKRGEFMSRFVQVRQELEEAERTAKTDADGRFRFDELAPGSYDALVRPSPLMQVERKGIEVAYATEIEVELELPTGAFLEGRVLGPPAASFANLGLSIAPPADPSHQEMLEFLQVFGERKMLRAQIEGDGRYRLGPLGEGDYVVSLVLPGTKMASGFSSSSRQAGATRELARVHAAAGEPPVDLNAAAIFPGSLTLSVTKDGRPVIGHRLVARNTSGPDGEKTGGILGADGSLRLEPVFPGDWTFEVEHIERRWTFSAPELVTLGPGEARTHSIEVRLYSGVLQVVDAATGETLPGTRVSVAPAFTSARGFFAGKIAQTDDEGWLELELAEGDYVLQRTGNLPFQIADPEAQARNPVDSRRPGALGRPAGRAEDPEP